MTYERVPDDQDSLAALWRRVKRCGADCLTSREAVELLLGSALAGTAAAETSRQLFSRFGSLRRILDARREELEEVEGLPRPAIVLLLLVRNAAERYLNENAHLASGLEQRKALIEYWRMRIGGLRAEVFEIAYLDGAQRLLPDGVERVAVGTSDRAAVYPRHIVEAVLRRHAAAVVLAHNHPSGDVAPTEHDRLVTRAVQLALDTVNVPILDHLVVSIERVFSFREAGLL